MVTGHRLADTLGILPRKDPAPTIAEHLDAEITNLQLSAGLGLAFGVAPGLILFEKSLDLSQSSRPSGIFQKYGKMLFETGSVNEPLLIGNRPASEDPHFPPRIFAMGNRGDSRDSRDGGSELPRSGISMTRMQSVISRLPEISKDPLPDLRIHTPYGTVEIQPNARFNSLGQLIRKLQSTAMSAPLAWEFETILWDFDPAANDVSSETLEKNLENVSRRVFEYYLQNRDLFYSLPEGPIPDWPTLHEREEEAFSPFWELKSIPDSRIYAYQASTPMTFSYLKQSKDPLFMAVFRVSNQDVTRILVTDKILKEMEESFQTQGKFIFRPQKEATGGASFELTQENYLGANPTTPYTLTQLGIEMFLSPPLFKAAFGLMDYLGVHDTDPTLAQETKKELQRASTLLLLGANERQVLDIFRKRILKKYYQNRKSFIDRMDFLRYDENFTFLPQLSPHLHILSPELRGTFFRFLHETHLSLYFNAESVMVLGLLRRIYQTRNQHLIHQLHYQAPSDEPTEIPHWISRFYFEHRKEILDLLRSNGEMN
jgi:hypothetical protein